MRNISIPTNSVYAAIFGVICGALMTIWISPYVIPTHEREHSIFVYGTLQNNLFRYYACRCLVPQTPATLPAYKKSGLNIIPALNNSVAGSVIQVSSNELARIDNYESVPQRYTRQTVTINEQTHWVYIKNDN